MHDLSRILVLVAFLLSVSSSTGDALARQSPDSKTPTGSISGRVTLNGKPAPGIRVILNRAFDGEETPVAKSTTDQDGRFQIADVPAGSFNLMAFGPAFVIDKRFGEYGKRLTVSPGETIEGIEISLKRGGAITGKVSDSSGQPVVEVSVMLTIIDEQARQHGFEPAYPQDARTDDRGIYRIFGVPEGRYIVSVGAPPNQRSASVGYSMTFHPGVGDESKAAVIDLAAGAEATGVDIVLGNADKAYTVRGRVVDAETGTPLSDIRFGYAVFYERRGLGAMGGIDARSDSQGNFRLDGIPPNHYAAFVVKQSDSEYYSDLSPFDVTDADVTGLEIKVRRGSSVSGIAVIDGLPDGDATAKLTGLRIRAFVQSMGLGAPSFGSSSELSPDGSFRIFGIRPGRAKLLLGGYPPPKGYALTRVERDGAEQLDGSVEIPAGEQISGVRVTIAYGTGVIRGQLKITGAAVPEWTTFSMTLKRAGADSNRPDWWTEADDRNKFLFEGLPPGDYEVIVSGDIEVPGVPASSLPEVRQRVTVTNGGDAEITIIIDLSAKDK